jgi:hypothetical protein
MWILPHVGLVDNELVDEWARQATLERLILRQTIVSKRLWARPFYFSRCDTSALVWGPKNRRQGLFALCQEFYLDIALFDHIFIDFELLKICCLCVCRRLWDSGPLDLALWKIPVEGHRLIDALAVLNVSIGISSVAWTCLEGLVWRSGDSALLLYLKGWSVFTRTLNGFGQWSNKNLLLLWKKWKK